MVLFCFRSLIQAKLLQSPEISGIHPDKLAHPEDEGHVPKENRYIKHDCLVIPFSYFYNTNK